MNIDKIVSWIDQNLFALADLSELDEMVGRIQQEFPEAQMNEIDEALDHLASRANAHADVFMRVGELGKRLGALEDTVNEIMARALAAGGEEAEEAHRILVLLEGLHGSTAQGAIERARMN